MGLTFKKRLIFEISSLVLMLLMMIFQAQLYTVKIILLCLIYLSLPHKIRITKILRIIIFLFILNGLWGSMIGIFNQATYPLSSITVLMIWPLLSIPIVAQIKEEQYIVLLRYLFWGHLFIVVYDILFAFSVIYGFTFFKIYPNVEVGFSYYETTSRMNFDNLNTLTFTTPIIFVMWLTKKKVGVNYLLLTITVLLSFFLLILSGRRSLMAIFIIIPLFIYFLRPFLTEKSAKNTIKMLTIFALVVSSGLCYFILVEPKIFEGYLYTFTKAFDADAEPVKFAQNKMLLNEFFKSPLWGHGIGYEFYEPRPGRMYLSHQYELTYQLKLAQGGIIGFVVYMLCTWGCFLYGVYLSVRNKDEIFIFILLGYFFVLLADATNPVLCSFDLMIPMFLTIGKIYLCKRLDTK